MNVLIFGASGRTGRELVQQALAQGHRVTAFVRDSTKLGIEHARLAIRQGDVTDYVSVQQSRHRSRCGAVCPRFFHADQTRPNAH
jgi:putative NADH-flavin reductase